VCRGLGLDDAGKGKAVLVERLTGAPAAAKTAPNAAKANGAARAAPPPAEKVDLSPSDHLTIDRLEGYLWSAADILRGSIDSSDYKNFIFGLLFLKRLSDRFDEECEALVAGGHDPEDADEHDFFVPKRARWSEIQKVATNLGETLNKACAALEAKNTALEGVLAGIDYNDERKLGDARNRDAVLARLVQHFSKLNVRNANLSEPDMLGRAYEYLIEKFADDAGKKGGEFYTPRMVVRLIVELLKPAEGRLARKGNGKESKLSYSGHVLMENRNGLCVDLRVAPATGHAERDEALEMLRRLRRRGYEPKTLAGDKGYCLGEFPQRVLDLGIKPHLAVPDNAPAHSPARRFVQSAGYKVSQVIRKRVEEIFGWGKSVAGLRRTRLKGRRKTWDKSYLIMAAYNLTRMVRLLRAAA